MNHIDEGLWILKQIGASESAQRAFALHPVVQEDAALLEFASSHNFNDEIETIDAYVLMLAMEYRFVANNYLASCPTVASIADIRLSPLKEVNQMLIADKVQNRKDFEIYHLKTHPNSERLSLYFNEWLQRLEVSESQYQLLVQQIKVSTGQI